MHVHSKIDFSLDRSIKVTENVGSEFPKSVMPLVAFGLVGFVLGGGEGGKSGRGMETEISGCACC